MLLLLVPVGELLRARDTLALLPAARAWRGAHDLGKLAMFISHMLLGDLQHLPLPPRGFWEAESWGIWSREHWPPSQRVQTLGHRPHY